MIVSWFYTVLVKPLDVESKLLCDKLLFSVIIWPSCNTNWSLLKITHCVWEMVCYKMCDLFNERFMMRGHLQHEKSVLLVVVILFKRKTFVPVSSFIQYWHDSMGVHPATQSDKSLIICSYTVLSQAVYSHFRVYCQC